MRNYYYQQAGKRHGPISDSELKDLAASNRLDPDAQVWTFSHAEGGTPRRRAKDIQGLLPTELSTTNLSFSRYYGCHFVATRGPRVLGISLGLIMLPILSLLKPTIGFRGLVITLVMVVILSLLAFLIHLLQRIIAYFAQEQRNIPKRSFAFLPALAFAGFLLCIIITPLISVEFFTPRCGLLATLIPQLHKEQVQLILDKNQEKAPDKQKKQVQSILIEREKVLDKPVVSSSSTSIKRVITLNEAEQIAAEVIAELKSNSTELIPIFREYCESSSKIYFYNRHLGELAYKLYSRDLIDRRLRPPIPLAAETPKTRTQTLDSHYRKFWNALIKISHLDQRSSKSKWWLGNDPWRGWRPTCPFAAYSHLKNPFEPDLSRAAKLAFISRIAKEGLPPDAIPLKVAKDHSELILTATLLRDDFGAPDMIPVINEFGQASEMEKLAERAYKLHFDLYQRLRQPYSNVIPEPPQPKGLTEIAGVTQIVQDDHYILGNKIILIPREYLPLFKQGTVSPNRIAIVGYFKYTGNTIGKNAFGADVNAELYFCDHEYCQETLRNRIMHAELSRLLPKRQVNKLPFEALIEDLTRFLDEEQIEEVQEIVKTNLPIERGFVFLAEEKPTESRGIYRTAKRNLMLESDCQLIYPTPGKSSILMAGGRGYVQIEQEGNILFEGPIQNLIWIKVSSEPITLTATAGQAALLNAKFIEPNLTFGKISVPPSRAIFSQDSEYIWYATARWYENSHRHNSR